MAKTMAYIRVSKDKQDVEHQRLEIYKLAHDVGLGQVTFIEETINSRIHWRDRKVADILDACGPGDAVVVAELSRLGRSMLEIMEILSVATTSGIRIYATKGNWRLDGSLQSKVVAMAFAMAAEIEGDLIRERTTAALSTRRREIKEKGFFISKAGNRVTSLGRPPGPGKSKLDAHRDEIVEMLELGVTRKRLAERLGCSESNLRHWLRMRGLTEVGRH
ncbi:MAG: recombinase family protein [Desulfosarcina sp.]|nr:recombinase family protein [Desulfosarcina sp.]MBC2741560.1 recombinase family protein [Desulfosarcina sp.]MBC2764474.1 recombinase family protein [Desulfosarcina sp.]